MENNELRHSRADSGELLPFQSPDLEPKLRRQTRPRKGPSQRKRTLAAGTRKRPIQLKAGRQPSHPTLAARGNGGQTPDLPKTQPPGSDGEADKARRPIKLKTDLEIAEWDLPPADKAPPQRPPRVRKKSARKGARKSSSASRTRAEAETPKAARPRKRQADRGSPGGTARRDKAPATPEGPAAPATEARHPTLSELWASWPPAWRRTVVSIGLSFLAGILFHALFVSGEPRSPQPAPAEQRTATTPAETPPPAPALEQQASPEPTRPPSGDDYYWGPTLRSPRTTPGLAERQYPPLGEPAPREGAGYGRGYGTEGDYAYAPAPYAAPALPYTAPAVPYAAPALPYAAPAVPYAAPALPYTTPTAPYATPAAPPRYETRPRDREQQPRRRYNPWAYESEGPRYREYR